MQMKCWEMRREAWLILWKGRWFWRLLLAGVLLGGVVFAVDQLATGACSSCQIPHWGEYAGQYVLMRLGELDMMVPTSETAWRMTAATLMLLLLGWIVEGCARFGEALVLRRAASGGGEGWLMGVYAGFRAPFPHLLLQLVHKAGVFAVVGFVLALAAVLTRGRCFSDWTSAGMLASLLVVPYLVAWHYFLPMWFVRAAHPDWGAGACLAETRRILKGNRRALFRLLQSYWALPLAVLGALACLGSAALRTYALPLLLPLALPLYLVVSRHMRVGVAVFWRECTAAAAGK